MKLRHIFEPKFGQEDEEPEVHAEYSFDLEGSPNNLPRDEDSCVRMRFKRFGRGEKPRNYEVEINWLDMKYLIQKFVEIGNPHAVHLNRILRLANSLEGAGWHHNDQPVEFWEDLLED